MGIAKVGRVKVTRLEMGAETDLILENTAIRVHTYTIHGLLSDIVLGLGACPLKLELI